MLSIQTATAQNELKKIDSLLTKAQAAYAKNPQNGIEIAKQGYAVSSKHSLPDKEIKSLYMLTYFYWGTRDFKNARLAAGNGLAIAREHHIDSLSGDFSVLIGAIEQIKNNYRQAIKWYQESIPYYNSQHLQKRIGNTDVDIGICETKTANFELANVYFLKSADIFQQLKDTVDLSATYNSMAACFSSLNNKQKAVNYYRDSYVLRAKLKDKALITQSLNNLGFAFNENNNPDSAIFYLSKCLAMRRQERDTSILVLTLQNLGAAWKIKGDLKKAEDYNLRAVKIAGNYSMKEDLAQGYLSLADIYITQKKYGLASADINNSEIAARELNVPGLWIDTYSARAELYKHTGNYKMALLFTNKKNKLKDSLFTNEKNKAINELEIKYQTRQKEKDIAGLHLQNGLEQKIVRQQRLSIFGLLIAAVLLLLLSVISYNNFRIKNRANLRIQTLMQDMHHRVKNNLQILSGIFTLQLDSLKDTDIKKALLENETRLTAMNLVHSQLYLDNSSTQIEMHSYLSKLLHHIKASFTADNINLRIEVPQMLIEADKAVAIGLIINELATNAFKYAFDDKGGELFLSVKRDGNSSILLQISDNGKGFDIKTENEQKSFGLKLVNLLARQLGTTLIIKTEEGTAYQMKVNI